MHDCNHDVQGLWTPLRACDYNGLEYSVWFGTDSSASGPGTDVHLSHMPARMLRKLAINQHGLLHLCWRAIFFARSEAAGNCQQRSRMNWIGVERQRAAGRRSPPLFVQCSFMHAAISAFKHVGVWCFDCRAVMQGVMVASQTCRYIGKYVSTITIPRWQRCRSMDRITLFGHCQPCPAPIGPGRRVESGKRTVAGRHGRQLVRTASV